MIRQEGIVNSNRSLFFTLLIIRQLAGGQDKIRVLEDPQNIISPCLQDKVQKHEIDPLQIGNLTQYAAVDVGFRPLKSAEPKDVWVPMSVEVAPLLRVEYIKAVSLFFNNGTQASITYDTIIGSYNNLKNNMNNIPEANKRRIGWVKYNFVQKSWTLRNTAFTRGIIKDAGTFCLIRIPVIAFFSLSFLIDSRKDMQGHNKGLH